MSALNYVRMDNSVSWRQEFMEENSEQPYADSSQYPDYPMFHHSTPGYTVSPSTSDNAPAQNYEIPEWQSMSSQPELQDTFYKKAGTSQLNHWGSGGLAPPPMSRSLTYTHPHTPYENLSDYDEYYGLSVSPDMISEGSRTSEATIDYPQFTAASIPSQIQYEQALNSEMSVISKRFSETSSIIDSEYHISITDHQQPTRKPVSALHMVEGFGPLTVIHKADNTTTVLPGIVKDDPSKQNITYWIPLDSLTHERHASISKEAHMRGLHLSSIASMLDLFSDEDGATKCPWEILTQERPTCPILEIDLFEAKDGAADEDTNRKVKGKEKIKRPLNSFMIYRRSQTQRAMINARRQNMKLDHKTISSVIGLLWQTERATVQDYFIQLSAIEKSRHRMLFPGYRFQPRRKSRSESSILKSKESAATAK